MKLKNDIEKTLMRADKLRREANKSGDKEALAYYEGICFALNWTLGKKDDNDGISQFRNIKHV